MKKISVFLLGTAFLLNFNASSLSAEDVSQSQSSQGKKTAKKGKKIAALIGKEKIDQNEIFKMLDSQFKGGGMQLREKNPDAFGKLYDFFVKLMVMNELLKRAANEAKQEGVLFNSKKEEKLYNNQILQITVQALIQNQMAKQLTDDVLKEMYKGKNEESANIYQMTFNDKETAQKAINKISKPRTEDKSLSMTDLFKKIAKQHSVSPDAKQNGGDSGRLVLSQLSRTSPDLKKHVETGLSKENLSKEPLKIGEKFIVLMLVNQSKATFDELRGALVNELQMQIVKEIAEKQSKKTKVEIYDLEGKEIPFDLNTPLMPGMAAPAA